MGKLFSRRTFLMGSVGLAAYLLFEEFTIAVKKYNVIIPNLPREFEGFKILHISDLHSKWFGDKQDYLLETINEHKFDIVAITGDIVNKRDPKVEPGLSLIEGLRDKPIFFVPGNHEWWSGYTIKEPLESLGVQILENKSFKFSKGNSHIWISGVDDPYLGKDDLYQCLSQIDDNQPNILLAHAPNIFDKASMSKIPLVLVGHTHGGQIRLPFIGAIVAPGQGLFPKYDYGLFNSENTNMIINGGLGESLLPIRFNIQSEIVFVSLTSGSGMPNVL